MRTQVRKFFQYLVVNLVVDHHCLLGRTDGSVIEGLGNNDVDHRRIQVRGLLQIDRRISWADT